MPPYKVNVAAVADRMNILIYGNPGAGKTHFIGTAQDHPDLSPVLVLNIEGGLITLASRNDIDAEDIHSIAELEEIFWKIANKDPEYKKYKTIAIDSVTELQSLCLLELVNSNIKKKGLQKTRTQDDVYLEDYGKSTNMLKRIFRMFRDCPINVIMTALPKTEQAPNGVGTSIVMPSLTSKLGESLMGYVDFVWYAFKEDDKEQGTIHKILTQDHAGYRAKTRGVKFAPALGLVYDNPNFPDLYELFLKSEGV